MRDDDKDQATCAAPPPEDPPVPWTFVDMETGETVTRIRRPEPDPDTTPDE